MLESGTLRSGNTYSVEFVDVDDTSLSNLSSTYIMTKDREPIRLAYGDYITIHSHTPDPVTADSLTANIIISPEIKPFQLYSLSTVVHNLSTALSVEIQTLSTNLSTDLSVENIRAMSVETELSDAISSKIYIDDVSTESLCAIHCSMDKYYRRVIDGDVLSNELYILSGEYVNVYNRKIKYVDTPVDSSDATTKGYVDDAISKLSTELSTQISALSNNISADVKRLSTELSTQISALSNNISADLKCLSTEVIDVSTLLSNDISCKIGADGRYLSTLSILHIDDDDYYDLVKNNHVNSDTLYIVSGDYNNAYDLQVKYVAAPTDGDDATNKTYVDGKFTEVDDRVTTLSSALMTELSVFADDTKTPDLYTISKALSAIYAAIK